MEDTSCLALTSFTQFWLEPDLSQVFSEHPHSVPPPPNKNASTEKACSPRVSPSAGTVVVLAPSLTSHLQVSPGNTPSLTSALGTPLPRSSALPCHHLRQTLGCKPCLF